MWKKFLIGALIVASNFGILTISEATQIETENYCCRDSYCDNYYGDRNCDGDYCSYGRGRGCC